MPNFKYILLLVVAMFGSYLSAQLADAEVQGQVSYLQVLSFPGAEPVEFEYDFYFSQSKGLFIRKEDAKTVSGGGLEPALSQTEEGTNLSFNFTTNHRWPLHTDLATKELKGEAVLYNRGKNVEYLVTEKHFPVRWKLSSEEKNIGSVLCRKATGYFRGREYEAWYAPEIPVRLGPWKFEGLPGLILEIYDTRKEVFFSATSIQLPVTGVKLPSTWLSSGKKVTEITLEKSIAIARNQKEEAYQAIMAKLPRGAVLEIEDKEANTIETRYEFDIK